MTIDALQWLDQRLETALFQSESTQYVFGIDSYYDGPCAIDYDPWLHAELLGVPVIARSELPKSDMVACYSKRQRAIFTLAGISTAVERCAVTHEIVHHEHGDSGTSRHQEHRADRIAAKRLIRPSRLAEFRGLTDDPGRIAFELDLTEHIVNTYAKHHA
ncbi:MAG: hypothetical protein ACRDT9_03985 [Agromyces sp.]